LPFQAQTETRNTSTPSLASRRQFGRLDADAAAAVFPQAHSLAEALDIASKAPIDVRQHLERLI